MRLTRLKPEQLENNVGYNVRTVVRYEEDLKIKTATRNTRMYLINKLHNK